MQLTESPPLTPGQCYLTADTVGPFIDTGFDIDNESAWGRMYLSAAVVGEMAAMLGWVPRADYESKDETITELIDALREATDRLAQFEEAARHLRASQDRLAALGEPV